MTPTDKLSELLGGATPGPWATGIRLARQVSIPASFRPATAGGCEMSDLVERLHDVTGFVQKEYGRVAAASYLATEAADRITALEAQLAAADRMAESSVRLVDVAVRISEVDNDNRMLAEVADTQADIAKFRAIRGGGNG